MSIVSMGSHRKGEKRETSKNIPSRMSIVLMGSHRKGEKTGHIGEPCSEPTGIGILALLET